MNDLLGAKFGEWIIIQDAGKDAKSNRLMLCRCSCGLDKIVRFGLLKTGGSTKCKACSLDIINKSESIINKSFGKWTVLNEVQNSNGNRRFNCRCDCGVEKEIEGYRLKGNKSRSCPHCRVKSHGMSYTSTYKIWRGILKRCLNQNFKAYKYYGGRGIKVCDRWLKFENFYEDMGIRPESLQIDRIDNDGNYEPQNCRWVTSAENNSNRIFTKKLKEV